MYGYELDLAKERMDHFVREAERVQAASQLMRERRLLAAAGGRHAGGAVIVQFPAAVMHALIG